MINATTTDVNFHFEENNNIAWSVRYIRTLKRTTEYDQPK